MFSLRQRIALCVYYFPAEHQKKYSGLCKYKKKDKKGLSLVYASETDSYFFTFFLSVGLMTPGPSSLVPRPSSLLALRYYMSFYYHLFSVELPHIASLKPHTFSYPFVVVSSPCSVRPCSVRPCSVRPCSVRPCTVRPCSSFPSCTTLNPSM